MGQQQGRRRRLGQARRDLAANGQYLSMTAIGRDPADGEEDQLRHCRSGEHYCKTRRCIRNWPKSQHGKTQCHGRREITQHRHGSGDDQKTLKPRHQSIVSTK
jgi:hypothetical protein